MNTTRDRPPRVLLGCTGSVASIKVPEIVQCLQSLSLEVAVIPTEHSLHFFAPEMLSPSVTVWRDADEWKSWKSRGDPVLHIDLRRWADLLLLAPLDAHTLAKASQGLCDNLLTCVLRAWDVSKPVLFCPAMNTAMWEHPLTGEHVQKLKQFGYIEVPVVVKTLMCGETGMGAMAHISEILAAVARSLNIENSVA